MSENLVLNRQRDRWYPLKPHPVQLALMRAVDDGIRFPVVPAGRRSGKTERAKRFLAKQAMWNPGELYFAGAPTFAQAKKIWWDDLKAMTLSHLHLRKPSETELRIFMPNGSEIHVLGFDQPSRFEGIPWSGGVIDEIADLKEDAVQVNIMPALNTVNPTRPMYRPWCWFIGVPEGRNHYYEMAQVAELGQNPDYKLFHWKSSEILPPDIIESAKRTMSAKQFRQEYEASFETSGGRIYEDYGPANYTHQMIHTSEELHWTHDQNYTPLSSAVFVVRQNMPLFLDEIILTSAVSRQAAEEFVSKFESHQNKIVYIYGDPSGRAGEKHGHKSDYDDIEDVLRRNGWKFQRRVRRSHPPIKDRQNAVRALIKSAANEIRMFVNPNKAPWCHKGLNTVELKQGSSFIEDQTNETQHVTTAMGYAISYLWPVGQNVTKSGLITGNF